MKHLLYVGLGILVIMAVTLIGSVIAYVYNQIPDQYQIAFLWVCWLLFMSYIFGYLTYETAIKHRLEKRNG